MDKPKLAALILASKKTPEEDDYNSEPKLGVMTLDSTLDDLFDALKADDKDAFKKAFKKSVNLCDNYKEDEEESE